MHVQEIIRGQGRCKVKKVKAACIQQLGNVNIEEAIRLLREIFVIQKGAMMLEDSTSAMEAFLLLNPKIKVKRILSMDVHKT